MKGVKHYKKDGTVHKGGTHKMPDGSLHSGKTHGKTSVALFHHCQDLNLSSVRYFYSFYFCNGCLCISNSSKFYTDCIFRVLISIKSSTTTFRLFACSYFGIFLFHYL